MKYIVASDIHGSAKACASLFDRYTIEGGDRLFLLGDILYHGPRNDLPEKYGPPDVVNMLNQMKNHIICAKGNCDAPVDEMVLDFPLIYGYTVWQDADRAIFLTHGHIYSRETPPPMKPGDLLLQGHTHVKVLEKLGDYWFMNPGSAAIPKDDSNGSYAVIEGNVLTLKYMDGSVIRSLEMK